MADLYIPFADFANPPTRKTAREVVAAFPQITGWTVHNGPFRFQGADVAAGVVVHTNQEPEPDAAAIVALATGHDGSADPEPFGTPFPIVQDFAALPAQPPDWPNDRALMAAVVQPAPALYFYARGAWRGPFTL